MFFFCPWSGGFLPAGGVSGGHTQQTVSCVPLGCARLPTRVDNRLARIWPHPFRSGRGVLTKSKSQTLNQWNGFCFFCFSFGHENACAIHLHSAPADTPSFRVLFLFFCCVFFRPATFLLAACYLCPSSGDHAAPSMDDLPPWPKIHR